MDLAPHHADSAPAAPPFVGPEPKLAASTVLAYERDLQRFQRFGGTLPATPKVVSEYLLAMPARLAPMTVYRRAMAVRYAHLSRGLPSPFEEESVKWMLQQLLKGFALKKVGTKSSRAREMQSAKPITRQLLLRMLDAMHRNSLDRRDRALLLLGFMGALNRSKLAGIDVNHVAWSTDALIVQLSGGTATVPLTGGDLCAATAVRNWIQHAALDTEGGPLFRRFDRGGNPTGERLDGAYVGVVLKERLQAVGIDPRGFSAHSLRRGRLLELGKGVL